MSLRGTVDVPVLLVIDLQEFVLAECAAGGGDVDGVLARTAALVRRARADGVPVVWVQDHQDHPVGSEPWRLAAPLAPRDDELRVSKGYRDAFTVPELVAALDDLGATRVVVTGAQSDFCVRTAAQSAAARGYDVTLVSDCHTTAGQVLDGATVTAAQIAAHVNRYFAGLRYPGQTFAVAPHETVALRAG